MNMQKIQCGILLTLSLGLVIAGRSRGAAKETESYFAAEQMPTLRIEISAEDQDLLRRHPKKYVRATVHEGEKVYRDVGVHLKGSKLGSFRPLEEKPSFTLNFDKFVDGQSFHGMDKVYLNNSVEDPTYVNEDVGGMMFRAAGVPAPRTAHARVELNQAAKGVYVLKEGFDRAWLKHWFQQSRGNLYEGGAREDITTPLEKDVGDKSPGREDLEALAKAAQESDPAKRWASLSKTLDIERFVTFAAMEVILWHWDGYCMNVNNYRLYGDPGSGKMVFIPHGMDVLFEEPEGPVVPKWQGLVAQGVMSTPEGKRAYQDKLRALIEKVFRLEDIEARIAVLEKRLQPALSDSERAKFNKGLATLRGHIRQRATFLQRGLASTQ
jgi:spore coat protein CotH